jgi:hypothetical protein
MASPEALASVRPGHNDGVPTQPGARAAPPSPPCAGPTLQTGRPATDGNGMTAMGAR